MERASLVIDTNIILAFLNEEKGRDLDSIEKTFNQIRNNICSGFIASITIAEIFKFYFGLNFPRRAAEALEFLKEAGITIVSLDEDLSQKTGILKSKYKMSYADCIILATAIETNSSLITYDPDFSNITEIEILKPEEFLKKRK
ncbi:MAG: PIN domain-containing protein [Candidatus Aenigmarchaeota archaeon]|nr:PIN domain-containing protein [Candidatus Aenigmarchaeota archaeon]